MRSPFPGMDPYLERHWLHVHQSFIYDTVAQLQPRLPKALRARMEERVYVEPEEESGRSIGPDVRVIQRSGARGRSTEAEGEGGIAVATGIAEPVILEWVSEPIHEGIVTIIDRESGGRVVTVIEFVSPTNKRSGDGREQYLKKRNECFAGGVNYVEVDLTRDGNRYAEFLPFRAPIDLRQTYQAWVRRAAKPLRYEVYPLSLREALPTIGIPLRQSDADIGLGLQSLVDQCYRNGGFDDIDYAAELTPPLSESDAAWAGEWLRSAGRR